MGIHFACHACGKALNIKQELAGKRGICPACRVRFRIPLRDAATSQPADPSDHGTGDVTSRQPASKQSQTETSSTQRASSHPISSLELLSGDPTANWYVRPPSGGQYGPATGDVLQQWIDEGRVATKSLLWRDGWPQWREASEVLPELAQALPSAGETFGYEDTPFSRRSSSRPQKKVTENPLNRPIEDESQVQRLSGANDLGKTRRERTAKRGMMIAGLASVAIVLLVVLIVVATRG
ncbi:DUF4339 domain-containing protein [Stieleria varia]|uniref:GYF domain-containing protein n=1 Tax=Stieleria varia TaxID=2528005 RepID=A0A5C6A022_9BACT|nr:DUF4339 domain-containing protein [Stieleria varia]TWT92745.1 hypothetical protein Pla52n_61100 [Stieleria varia]